MSNKTTQRKTKNSSRKRWHNPAAKTLDRAKQKTAAGLGKLFNWLNQTWARRITAVLLILFSVAILFMYGIAQWYIASNQDKPYRLGTTFIATYAESFGLNPQDTLEAVTGDLGFEHLRLVSYWSVHEAKQGTYDFSELDWQFEHAEAQGTTVSLAIGLRQPRWPECHMPAWAEDTPREEWYPALLDYTEATIERYKDSPALVSYQLENEFLLDVFGDCPDHDRERLVEEYNFVKSLDPDTPIIVSRSDNITPSWPVGEPHTNKTGMSVYKRVWDKTMTKRYFEYPLPPWFYAFLAGGAKLTTGQETFIHELQAEAWLPYGMDIQTASTEELHKSMHPDMLRRRFEYGRATGIKEIDLWGVEWWYYRKVAHDDDSFWEVAREQIEYTDELNQGILKD